MPFNSSSKRIPLSDAWLEEVGSDDSDSMDAKPRDVSKKPKFSKSGWTASDNRIASSSEEDANDGSANVDGDDADDEDWTVSDHAKKRMNRVNASSRHSGLYKLPQSCQSSLQQRDRARPKSSSQVFSRPCHGSSSNARSTRLQPHSAVKPANRPAPAQSTAQKKVGQKSDDVRPGSTPFVLPCEMNKPRQCFGPGCTRAAARPDTKYCSQECGIRLAIRRLQVLLPERLQNTNLNGKSSTDVAELLYRTKLSEIQKEKCTVRDRLLQLEAEHQQLSSLITRARETKLGSNQSSSFDEMARDVDQVEQIEPVVCVTCSSEVSMRHALRHMEKCFQKFIRIDDLLQEEQRMHQSIAQRGGVLGLLLHQTIDHNPGVSVPLPSELLQCQSETGRT